MASAFAFHPPSRRVRNIMTYYCRVHGVEVLDLWFEKKLKKGLRGHAELIRYCDDFVICAQYRSDASRVLEEIKTRLAKFGLEVSVEKTRIIEFGRFAKRRYPQLRAVVELSHPEIGVAGAGPFLSLA